MDTPTTPHKHFQFLSLSLALFSCAAYLLFYSGVFHSSDAAFIVAATESIVKRGEFSTDQLWWHQGALDTVAPDGEAYSKYGIAPSLIALPLYLLALHWPSLGMVQAVTLTNILITALTATLVLKLVRAWGYTSGIALSVSLCFALCTSALVYANFYFTEPLSALAFAATILTLYHYRACGRMRYLWFAGFAMSLAVATKLVNALFLVPFLLYTLDSLRRRSSPMAAHQIIRASLPLIIPLLGTLIGLGLYNAVRFGDPFVSGYAAYERFDYPVLAGLWGLLLSSEKGLFFYNPILLASLVAFPLFGQRHRAEAWLVLGLSVLHLFSYAIYYLWEGGVAWGPRYLVPLLPLLVLPLAPGLAFIRARGTAWTRRARVGLAALCALSLGVQVVGASVSFLRYYNTYGNPATRTSDALHEWALHWPILGHALLFGPAHWDVAWVQHQANEVAIDWISLSLLIIFLLLATLGLVAAYRRRHDVRARWLQVYQLGLIAVAVSVSLLLLVRVRDDVRFGGGDDYRALLQMLAALSTRDDVLLLDNHIYTNFFFNHNRSPARWYALDRDSDASERTRQLLARSTQRYQRIWLVTDLSPVTAKSRPIEAWLTQHAYKLDDVAFSPYARLLLYDTTTQTRSARQPLDARLAESITLTAFELAAPSSSEHVWRLTLYWQTQAKLSHDFTVFVQLLDASGRVVWQADRYPVDGFRPTTSWAVGETVIDRYAWRLNAAMPPDKYRLIVGMYDWRTGKRLPISDARGAAQGDYVLLSTAAR